VSFIFIFRIFRCPFPYLWHSFYNDIKICVTSYFMYEVSHEGKSCTKFLNQHNFICSKFNKLYKYNINQGSPNQAKWATSSPWFQWSRRMFPYLWQKRTCLHNDLKRMQLTSLEYNIEHQTLYGSHFRNMGILKKKYDYWWKDTDLKRLTGRLKLRFLTEIGRLHWNQGVSWRKILY
jgi:hypothetical protein